MYIIDWEETLKKITSLINAFASLATVGAFLYLFRKDREKQTQIDKLTSIAKELTLMKAIDNERLNLSVKPDLKFKSMTNGTDGTLGIRIINNGERTILIGIEILSNDLSLTNNFYEYRLEKNTEHKISFHTSGNKHINDSEYSLKILYIDKINNHYVTEIKGKGVKSKIQESKIYKAANFN